MNHTQNYNLNQWEASDQLRRVDVNADNAKIDAAIKAVAQTAAGKGNCRIAYGSYTGTGKYGQAHPNTLTFPFQPKVVLIALVMATNAADYMIAVQGQSHCCNFNTNGGGYNECTWSGNSFTWYSTTNEGVQFNSSKYLYVAFG